MKTLLRTLANIVSLSSLMQKYEHVGPKAQGDQDFQDLEVSMQREKYNRHHDDIDGVALSGRCDTAFDLIVEVIETSLLRVAMDASVDQAASVILATAKHDMEL
ncbi:hypothetical protein Tco_0467848 [Tanacetum coccineum]